MSGGISLFTLLAACPWKLFMATGPTLGSAASSSLTCVTWPSSTERPATSLVRLCHPWTSLVFCTTLWFHLVSRCGAKLSRPSTSVYWPNNCTDARRSDSKGDGPVKKKMASFSLHVLLLFLFAPVFPMQLGGGRMAWEGTPRRLGSELKWWPRRPGMAPLQVNQLLEECNLLKATTLDSDLPKKHNQNLILNRSPAIPTGPVLGPNTIILQRFNFLSAFHDNLGSDCRLSLVFQPRSLSKAVRNIWIISSVAVVTQTHLCLHVHCLGVALSVIPVLC